MTVKDVLKTVALLINRADILDFFNNGYTDDYNEIEDDVNLLITCYNIVADEIATEYYKLNMTEKFTCQNGVLKFSQFTKNPIIINSIKDDDGNDVKYKALLGEITLDKPLVNVEYSYTPDTKGLDDISDYSSTPINKRVIAYGVATEYLLVKGAFEEAVVWHDKYVESLKGSVIKSKNKKLKGRIWR